MMLMRGLLCLCTGALAPTVGIAVASAAQERNPVQSLAFGSTHGSATRGTSRVGSSRPDSRCAVREIASANAARPTMSFAGASTGRGAMPESAGAAASAAATKPAVCGTSSWPALSVPAALPLNVAGHRRRPRRGWVPALAAAAASSDANDSGVMDQKAEFYGNSAPGAVAPEGAEKQDNAAVDYAVAGDWEKSVQLIKAMRDSDFVPSVNAYVATIEACRRVNQFDYATTLLSDMNKVCLPEDLIKEYAAKHPNAPGVTQTQKVFCLAMMMRQDKIEPFEETYRAIMGLASKEKLWQVSLLLVEHLKRNGLVPGKFVYDEICSVLFKTGHPEMATMMFEQALADDAIEELNSFAAPKLDLHNHTVSTALAAVRVVLLDMARKPSSRAHHDPTQELLIITGMGNNSKDGEAVIKPRVMELLTDMGLEPSMMRNNEGCIVLQPADLQAYLERTSQA